MIDACRFYFYQELANDIWSTEHQAKRNYFREKVNGTLTGKKLFNVGQ